MKSAVLPALLLAAWVFDAMASEPLFRADSKSLAGASPMDVVVREVERLPRASVIEVDVTARGSSVGASFFLMCSLRRLAQQRGGYRYVVMLEERPKPEQMLVGFLRNAADDPRTLGPAFQGVPADKVVDLEQAAPICEQTK